MERLHAAEYSAREQPALRGAMMSRTFLFVVVGFACAFAAVAAAPPSAAQSSIRLPPASGVLGGLRRGRDGQIEVVPGAVNQRQGPRSRGAPRTHEPGPPPGTPWTAKTQHTRTPQLQFEEANPDN